jgi:hypothetical protein
MNTAKTLVMLIACCVCALAGCRATPKANYRLERRTINILSEPEGATVTQLYPLEQGSRKLGETPCRRGVLVMTDITYHDVPFSEAAALYAHEDNVVVILEKDRYEPYRATMRTKPGESVARKFVLKPLSPQ